MVKRASSPDEDENGTEERSREVVRREKSRALMLNDIVESK